MGVLLGVVIVDVESRLVAAWKLLDSDVLM